VSATIFVNGKFTCQPTTGVQRVAEQLVRALDALVPRPGEARWLLLHPPGGGLSGLGRIEQRSIGAGGSLHAWEQWSLPRAARSGLLLNLSGSAPYFSGRTAAMLHDAAVFDHPAAYSLAFGRWYRFLFARLGRCAERLFTVSAFSQTRLAAALHVPTARFQVLPNAADHLDAVVADESVLDFHALRGRRYLLAVASANPTKNLPALVHAFAHLACPDLALVIVGGRNARVFAGEAAATDPPGVVRTGSLDDAPLKALYRHAVALVFPSLYEGFGLPALEAMNQGCAVAAANVAALPEVCGDAALYFDPTSPAAIADALRRIVDDDILRARLQHAGRRQAARFSWVVSAEGLRAALDGTVASP
jgi:glycosyltransferase involved in cell wall biosynthesis